MDKNTLGNYGWVVIAMVVLAVMITFATPFGVAIQNGVNSATDQLVDRADTAIGSLNSGGGAGGATITMLNAQANVGQGALGYFRSDEDLSNNAGVKVDGVVVDPSNYELKSGSTIVILKESYTATLSKGAHTIDILSKSGEYASANFEVDDAIEFTIEGVGTYKASKGMTWGDWISSYGISAGDNGIVWICYDGLGGYCTAEDIGHLCVDWGSGLGANQIVLNGKNNYVMLTDVIQATTYNVNGPAM